MSKRVNLGKIVGEDGFSPLAKVERTENGAKIVITDAEGTTEAEVFDGKGGTGSDVKVPTKVSELENDSKFATEEFVKNKIAEAELGGEGGEIDLTGFATKEELNNKVDKEIGKSLIADSEIERLAKVTNYNDTQIKQDLTELSQELDGKAGKSEIPTNLSDLNNDSDFATEGYVDEEIAKFDFIKVVDVLPETGLPNRIYFVPKVETETQDLFDEFAWINDSWEYITTKQIEVDLTTYATIEYVNGIVGDIESLLQEV